MTRVSLIPLWRVTNGENFRAGTGPSVSRKCGEFVEPLRICKIPKETPFHGVDY
jgi:hypothetical protein